MAKIKIGINGMGRIGRTIIRECFNREIADLEIVAVNNPGDPKTYVHLLKRDSIHGTFSKEVKFENKTLKIANQDIRFYSEKDPAKIPWSETGVQIVIDATGRFKNKETLSAHIRDSVQKVVMCAPGDNLDATFVYGINHENYNSKKHNVVSNASCTTNCLAPVAKVLHDSFGIERGLMTTVHAYTSDQALLDSAHKDPRRGRAAAMSMIPTTTGAAKAVGLVIPELAGKLDGFAIRVPTPDVSVVDLTVELKKAVNAEDINNALKAASEGGMKGVLGYTTEPLVSIDFIGARESSIVDASLTNVIGSTAKVIAWYDNEVGFSNRVIDLVNYMGEKL